MDISSENLELYKSYSVIDEPFTEVEYPAINAIVRFQGLSPWAQLHNGCAATSWVFLNKTEDLITGKTRQQIYEILRSEYGVEHLKVPFGGINNQNNSIRDFFYTATKVLGVMRLNDPEYGEMSHVLACRRPKVWRDTLQDGLRHIPEDWGLWDTFRSEPWLLDGLNTTGLLNEIRADFSATPRFGSRAIDFYRFA